MNRRNDKALGNYGEALVKDYYEFNGYHVKLSEDVYDSVKDMTVSKNGISTQVEVKTQVVMENLKINNKWQPSVSIHAIQSNGNGSTNFMKCMNVDVLNFVVLPWAQKTGDTYKYYGTAHLFELEQCNRQKVVHGSKTSNYKSGSYYIALHDLKHKAKISVTDTEAMLRLTTSQFRAGFRGYPSQYCLDF